MKPTCRRHAPKPGNAVADILIRNTDAFLLRYGNTLRIEQRKALQSIHQCRTPAMGGRSYRCAHCEKDHFAWRSCNHRLCPACGSGETQRWVSAQLEKRLPVEHFMVTFTLPSSLRPLYRREPKAFLSAFYAASSQAIKDVLKDPRHLGGQSGFIGILQTWKQDLRLHPHIHYIVPAVGIDGKGKLKRPKKAGWLARGDVFASRMRTLLLQALSKRELLGEPDARPLWKAKWNCDVKPFGNGANAIKYLGTYLKQGPISNARILESAKSRVVVSVKDRQAGETNATAIESVEFVRRYLQHALPRGFHAVRHYGFLHSRSKAKLQKIREQLGIRLEPKSEETPPSEQPTAPLCPRCRAPMELTGQLSRAPPWERSIPKIWARNAKAAA